MVGKQQRWTFQRNRKGGNPQSVNKMAVLDYLMVNLSVAILVAALVACVCIRGLILFAKRPGTKPTSKCNEDAEAG